MYIYVNVYLLNYSTLGKKRPNRSRVATYYYVEYLVLPGYLDISILGLSKADSERDGLWLSICDSRNL